MKKKATSKIYHANTESKSWREKQLLSNTEPTPRFEHNWQRLANQCLLHPNCPDGAFRFLLKVRGLKRLTLNQLEKVCDLADKLGVSDEA